MVPDPKNEDDYSLGTLIGHLFGGKHTRAKNCWKEIWNLVFYFMGNYPNLWDSEEKDVNIIFSIWQICEMYSLISFTFIATFLSILTALPSQLFSNCIFEEQKI